MIEPWSEMVYQLVLGAIFGALVGLERGFYNRPAGLRTFALVGLGSTLFSIMSVNLASTNIVANIITGIGFLGAGLIFHQGTQTTGVTTAGAVWVTAAIGVAIGQAYYVEAFVTMLLTIIILAFLPCIERGPKS